MFMKESNDMTKLSQDKLKSLLSYDKETGDFTWIKSPSKKIRARQVAGGINDNGYVTIGIFKQRYLAHRLVFLYEFGEMPSGEVDHINRVRNDNRSCNLRQCSRSGNQANAAKSCLNKSGYKGVYWKKSHNAWCAKIKRKFIGYFPSKESAAKAYNEKALEHFGEYAHLNKINRDAA